MSDEPNDIPPEEEGQEADYRLRAVISAMPVPASWARLEDGRIVFMNRKFTQLFGYQLVDFEDVEDWFERVYPDPDQCRKIRREWGIYFQERPPEEQYMPPLEVDVLCKDGTVKTTILSGVILPMSGLMVATWVDISERKREEIQIQQLAEQDSLTGLRNRRSFDAFLERSLEGVRTPEAPIYLLIVDLDRFKPVNDTYGHQFGDTLLQEVARRIESTVRSSDLVARFGGDEFGLILTDTETDAAADRVCEKLLEAVSRPYEVGGEVLQVGASIGISRFPSDAVDPERLFRLADQALYRAKRGGRGTWCYPEGPAESGGPNR